MVSPLARIYHGIMLTFAETSSHAKPAILALPAELHINIFELIDKDTSTCLSLTCRSFYAIHRDLNPRTEIKDLAAVNPPTDRELHVRTGRKGKRGKKVKKVKATTEIPVTEAQKPILEADEKCRRAFKTFGKGSPMPRLLREFMGPDRVFEPKITCQFITRERYLVLTKAYRNFHSLFADSELYPGPMRRDLVVERECRSRSMRDGVSKFLETWTVRSSRGLQHGGTT
jgi:hypothetical protein